MWERESQVFPAQRYSSAFCEDFSPSKGLPVSLVPHSVWQKRFVSSATSQHRLCLGGAVSRSFHLTLFTDLLFIAATGLANIFIHKHLIPTTIHLLGLKSNDNFTWLRILSLDWILAVVITSRIFYLSCFHHTHIFSFCLECFSSHVFQMLNQVLLPLKY